MSENFDNKVIIKSVEVRRSGSATLIKFREPSGIEYSCSLGIDIATDLVNGVADCGILPKVYWDECSGVRVKPQSTAPNSIGEREAYIRHLEAVVAELITQKANA